MEQTVRPRHHMESFQQFSIANNFHPIWDTSLSRLDAYRAVYGHFAHPHDRPWKDIDQCVLPGLARLVGKSASPAFAASVRN
jgi:hypothetical protein